MRAGLFGNDACTNQRDEEEMSLQVVFETFERRQLRKEGNRGMVIFRKKLLLIFLFFLSGVFLLSREGWSAEAGKEEIKSYVPLKLYFSRAYDASSGEGVLSGDGAVYFINDDSDAPYSRDPGRKVVRVTNPTPEQWKKLYDICEAANIWGLGEISEFLPEENYEFVNVGTYWEIILEYPGRRLNVEGNEIFVPEHIDVPGSLSQYGVKTIIAKNLIVAKEYPKLQEIFCYLYELAAPPNRHCNMLHDD